MAKVTTLPEILWPLMEGPSVETPYCCVCGRAGLPLNRHHVVRRGAGKLYRDGVEVPKPTVMLCGSGNTSGCHGLAHQNRLHFRYVKDDWNVPTKPYDCPGGYEVSLSRTGHWEWLLCESPTKYADALKQGGWHALRHRRMDFGC